MTRARMAVIVATTGRADDVAALLGELACQTRRPDLVVLAVATLEDIPASLHPGLRIVSAFGPKGLPTQRNRGLQAAGTCDVAAFFDDDFLPAPDYLQRIEEALIADPALTAVDGRVVFDGATGAGIDWSTARRILEAADPGARTLVYDQPDGLYGCNMCCRVGAVGPSPFDENLPLYGWLEDYDFGRRVARGGRIGRVMDARGVHLGVKRSRTSGLRMGYSQVANPIYLLRKGTMPAAVCLGHLLRRPLGNLVGALRGDVHVDRTGRLRGNLVAVRDMLLGRLSPERIVRL